MTLAFVARRLGLETLAARVGGGVVRALVDVSLVFDAQFVDCLIERTDVLDGDDLVLGAYDVEDGAKIGNLREQFPIVPSHEAMRYPPENQGSWPRKSAAYGRTFDEYVDRANEDLRTLVQIETARGVENADQIASIDGVDAVLVGQGDLSGSLGVLGDWSSDEFQSALQTIVDAVHGAEKPLCMLAMDNDGITRWIEAGADILIAGVDVTYLAKGSDSAREAFEDAI